MRWCGKQPPGHPVENINLVESERPLHQFLHAAQRVLFAVKQVIDDHHVATALQDFQAGMAADIAGAAPVVRICIAGIASGLRESLRAPSWP